MAEEKSNEKIHEENNTFVATETGEAPTAEDYLGDGEYTSSAPILQGSPHYHNGRLITTQEELDEYREAVEKDRQEKIAAAKDAQSKAEGKSSKKK